VHAHSNMRAHPAGEAGVNHTLSPLRYGSLTIAALRLHRAVFPTSLVFRIRSVSCVSYCCFLSPRFALVLLRFSQLRQRVQQRGSPSPSCGRSGTTSARSASDRPRNALTGRNGVRPARVGRSGPSGALSFPDLEAEPQSLGRCPYSPAYTPGQTSKLHVACLGMHLGVTRKGRTVAANPPSATATSRRSPPRPRRPQCAESVSRVLLEHSSASYCSNACPLRCSIVRASTPETRSWSTRAAGRLGHSLPPMSSHTPAWANSAGPSTLAGLRRRPRPALLSIAICALGTLRFGHRSPQSGAACRRVPRSRPTVPGRRPPRRRTDGQSANRRRAFSWAVSVLLSSCPVGLLSSRAASLLRRRIEVDRVRRDRTDPGLTSPTRRRQHRRGQLASPCGAKSVAV